MNESSHQERVEALKRLDSIAVEGVIKKIVKPKSYACLAGVLLDDNLRLPGFEQKVENSEYDMLAITSNGLLLVIVPRTVRELTEDKRVMEETISTLGHSIDPVVGPDAEDWDIRRKIVVPRTQVEDVLREGDPRLGFRLPDVGRAAVFAHVKMWGPRRSDFDFWVESRIQSASLGPAQEELAAQDADRQIAHFFERKEEWLNA